MSEYLSLEEDLADEDTFQSMLQQFSRVGRKDLKDCVHKVLDRSVPEMSQKCPRDVPEVSQRCPRDVPEMSQKCPRDVLEVSQRCPRGIPEVSQG
uniref:Uncharacterized protein n=1 Tax=Knipowitschia caucasica TaxID=637954 RepID=A0AAV2K3K3_KNICA